MTSVLSRSVLCPVHAKFSAAVDRWYSVLLSVMCSENRIYMCRTVYVMHTLPYEQSLNLY
jgi:hypothetical protein